MTFALKNMTTVPPFLRTDNLKVEIINHFRYLGVWLDSKLNFHHHLWYGCTKMSSKIRPLSKHKLSFLYKFLKCFSNSLVLSISHYCSIVWGHLCKTDKAKFDRLYRRAIRNVLPNIAKTCDLYIDCIEKLNWLAVEEYRKVISLEFVFKKLLCTDRTK